MSITSSRSIPSRTGRSRLIRAAALAALVVVTLTTAATPAQADDADPQFTVAIEQHCALRVIPPNRLVRADRVTLTFTDPHARGPFWDWDGSYTINYRFWLREQPMAGPYAYSDVQAAGSAGGGSVLLPTGEHQITTTFWVPSGTGMPWLQVLATDMPLDWNVIAPAQGAVQPVLADCP